MRRNNSLNPFTALIAIAFVGLAASFVSPTEDNLRNACLWDYDTLRYEAQGMPSTIEAITGRFDRFPPLYYEMRLERVASELESDPTRLDLYDDAGVACDRLGRYDEAIAWMARKRAQLDAQPDEEHEYRYLANLGTFHAHRWIAGNREELSDIESAADLIALAIELNPDAHFGRERYQLLAIEWLRASYDPSDTPPGEHPEMLRTIWDADQNLMGVREFSFPRRRFASHGYDDVIEGLSGLISLGAAWESIDVLAALHIALMHQADAHVAYVVELRIDELEDRGLRSLHPSQSTPIGRELRRAEYQIYDDQQSKMDRFYETARLEADQWRASRNLYLLERLRSGAHPDTDPEFWSEWVYTSDAPTPPGSTKPGSPMPSMGFLVAAFGVVVLGLLIATALMSLCIRWLLRKHAAKAHA